MWSKVFMFFLYINEFINKNLIPMSAYTEMYGLKTLIHRLKVHNAHVKLALSVQWEIIPPPDQVLLLWIKSEKIYYRHY